MNGEKGLVNTANPPAIQTEIPEPRGHPILGNLPEIQRDRLGFLIDAARRFGPVMSYRVGPIRFIQVNSPEGVQHILQANNHNYTKQTMSVNGLRDIMGTGLLLSDGDSWLKQRRLMQPAFHRQKIQAFSTMIVEEVERTLKDWRAEAASGQLINLSREMMRLTLSIITRAMFNDRIGDESGAIGASVTTLLEDSIYRFDHPLYPPRWFPTPRNRRYARAKANLRTVIDGIIQRRQTSAKEHGDLLDMLILARDEDTGEGMSPEQLRQETITLFIAGHETTAVLLSWAFYLLAMNPQARERLQEEIHRVLSDRAPTQADLPDLAYTRMVLEETMRLYPPAWITGRKSIQGDEIHGYTIPAGAEISISPYITHRDPQLWPNPELFDPERFSPERSAGRHRYAYFPFGGGPRQCIGNNFAMMEAHLILAAISQGYSLDLAPGREVEVEPLITLRPKEGPWMILHPKSKLG
jgi:cytochrome P450